MERHARDFMEAAKKLQLYFISLQREDQPTKAETLAKVIKKKSKIFQILPQLHAFVDRLSFVLTTCDL